MSRRSLLRALAGFLGIATASDAHAVTDHSWKRARCSWFQGDQTCAIVPDPRDRGAFYCACRWDYDALSRIWGIPRNQVKARLAQYIVEIRSDRGASLHAVPADWGPHHRTGRGIDLSRKAYEALGVKTDEEVEFRLRENA